MSKLAANPVHTDLLRVERATLGHFVSRRHVLFLHNLVLAVREGASVPKAAHVQLPVLADLGLLLDAVGGLFVVVAREVLVPRIVCKFKLELLIRYATTL